MREIDRTEFKARARDILAQHVGPDDCVSMYQLYQTITGHPIIPMRKVNQTRLVRSIIAELHEEGEPIVHKSGPDGGYYTAEKKEEIEQEAAWFRKRALSAFRREKMLRRISTEELLRQYQLELNQQEENQP